MKIWHLTKRFFGSLRPGGPSAEDEEWVRTQLVPGEADLWQQMSNPDRRHAAGVARAAVAELGGNAEPAVVAAALLHDVGKIDSGYGTFARVYATVAAAVAGRERLEAGEGRLARYLRHPEIGAELLRDAGAAPLTIGWAREHHLPESAWTVDPSVGRILKAVDDD